MLKRKLIVTGSALAVFGILGVIYIAMNLPVPPSNTGLDLVSFYIFDFCTVVLGPFVLIWVLDLISIPEWILIGSFSSISIFMFVYFLKNPTQMAWKLVFPAVVWVAMGTYLLFWGLAAGV